MDIVKEFVNRVDSSEGIVCYGVGQRLQDLTLYFREDEIINKILFCVDKNKDLHGTKIKLNQHEVCVYSVEHLEKISNKNIVLLITNVRFDKVLRELTQYSFGGKLEYFCLSHILADFTETLAMNKILPRNIQYSDEAKIPKIIHYCWFGGKPIPNKYKKWMNSWKKYCPDYEIIEWNESNYDVTKNQYMHDAYKNEKWGFVPDYARLDIIYQYGGIYLDVDVELVQSLDELRYQEGFVGFEDQTEVNFGSGFGAAKGNRIIRELRDEYDRRKFVNEDGSLNLLSSPFIQTEYFLKKGLVQNGEYQKLDGFSIYPEKMFSSKSLFSRRVKMTEYTKAIHHFDATWKDEEQRTFYGKFEEAMQAENYEMAHGFI